MKSVKKYIKSWRVLSERQQGQFKVVKIDESGDLLQKAKKLHADVYLLREFITKEHINEEGHIHSDFDPHQHHSLYFVVISNKTNEVVAVARQISWEKNKARSSFPLLQNARLYKTAALPTKKQQQTTVEISALVKKQQTSSTAVLMLYREMWRYSIEVKHSTWIMACDVNLYKNLSFFFGPALVRIGYQTKYRGGDIIPVMLSPKTALNRLQTGKRATMKESLIRNKIITFMSQK